MKTENTHYYGSHFQCCHRDTVKIMYSIHKVFNMCLKYVESSITRENLSSIYSETNEEFGLLF
jgi:hypothetical protein